jgi:hypothetical protein
LALIEHLEEIQSRRLHAELGYESLWAFCTQYLGLSEGAAQRRISAMRLTRDVPEAKAALQSGKLSLSNAAQVQNFRQAQKKQGLAPSDPRELIQKVEHLSQRECEAKLFEISPQALPIERERVVSAAQDREIRLVISPELHERLQRIKGLIAHAKPNASYAELLEYLVGETLPRLEKKKGLIHVRPADQKAQVTIAAAVDGGDRSAFARDTERAEVTSLTASTAQPSVAAEEAPFLFSPEVVEKARSLPQGKRVYLPAALRRAVYARAGGRCEYTIQGQRCGSRYMLEIDHRVPISRGGGHEFSQLRTLCRSHNLQQFRSYQR